MVYLDSVDDPLYAAHDITSLGFYFSDWYFRVLGCVEQYQICSDSRMTSCTSLDAHVHVSKQIHDIELNAAQMATADLFMNFTATANIIMSVFGPGSSALLAGDSVFTNFISEGLPSNQWQLESNNFFAMSLARVQALVIDYASKSSTLAVGEFLTSPSSDEQRYLCNNTKMRNVGGYESFIAAAVCIIVGVGLVIIIIGWKIDAVFGAIQKRFQWRYDKVEQWKTDSMFQQQRIALSVSGYGHWTGAYDDIPLTGQRDVLAVPRKNDDGLLVYKV